MNDSSFQLCKRSETLSRTNHDSWGKCSGPFSFLSTTRRSRYISLGYDLGSMEEPDLLEDLTLLLLCAQSWREKIAESLYVSRSWKGYDFDVLDRLARKRYISGSHGAKSVILTDEGLKRGEELKRRLLTKVDELWT